MARCKSRRHRKGKGETSSKRGFHSVPRCKSKKKGQMRTKKRRNSLPIRLGRPRPIHGWRLQRIKKKRAPRKKSQRKCNRHRAHHCDLRSGPSPAIPKRLRRHVGHCSFRRWRRRREKTRRNGTEGETKNRRKWIGLIFHRFLFYLFFWPQKIYRIPVSLVERTSLVRGALPVLPLPFAWLCLIFNALAPGVGKFNLQNPTITGYDQTNTETKHAWLWLIFNALAPGVGKLDFSKIQL